MRSDSQPRLPLNGSLAGEVLLSGQPRRVGSDADPARLEQLAPDAAAAILVPLVFRGEPLVAKEDHAVVEQRRADLGQHILGQILG